MFTHSSLIHVTSMDEWYAYTFQVYFCLIKFYFSKKKKVHGSNWIPKEGPYTKTVCWERKKTFKTRHAVKSRNIILWINLSVVLESCRRSINTVFDPFHNKLELWVNMTWANRCQSKKQEHMVSPQARKYPIFYRIPCLELWMHMMHSRSFYLLDLRRLHNLSFLDCSTIWFPSWFYSQDQMMFSWLFAW